VVVVVEAVVVPAVVAVVAGLVVVVSAPASPQAPTRRTSVMITEPGTIFFMGQSYVGPGVT
jgi:hypothetical protein